MTVKQGSVHTSCTRNQQSRLQTEHMAHVIMRAPPRSLRTQHGGNARRLLVQGFAASEAYYSKKLTQYHRQVCHCQVHSLTISRSWLC